MYDYVLSTAQLLYKEDNPVALLYKFLASIACQCFACFFFYLLRRHNKHAIVETGYRNDTRLRKPQSKKLPLWNRVIFWEMCNSAKRNHKAVWIYFGFNLVVCLAWTFSPVLAIICIFCMNLDALIIWELGYALAVLLLTTLIQFPVDLTFLPSEQKRYRMSNKQKK